jgi:hypothetical protein
MYKNYLFEQWHSAGWTDALSGLVIADVAGSEHSSLSKTCQSPKIDDLGRPPRQAPAYLKDMQRAHCLDPGGTSQRVFKRRHGWQERIRRLLGILKERM